ncbi:hypothetical protein C8J56DRAFT_1046761 [Mycena floridula]|nr:hypothetical protein C8J56DRAFT_1046761 [Mycena floridula]
MFLIAMQPFCVLLVSFNSLFLQQHNLAREAYLAASEPTLAAKTLIDMADVSASIDFSFNEISLLEQAQQELQSIDEDDGQDRGVMACCLILLGEAYSHRHNHSEAFKHLTRARYFCSDLPFEKAEKWAVLAVNKWKGIGGYLGISLWVLGQIYISRAQYDQALKSLEEGLQCAKTYGDQQDTANILLELGRAHMKKGNNNDAKKSLREALMNYGSLESMKEKIVCQYYLTKLDDPSRVPTLEEKDALDGTWHEEDTYTGA